MPQTMCCDPICSEHYLWHFDGGFLLEAYTAVYCYRVVISQVAKAVVCKLDLSRGGLTRCHGVLNLHWNIPLKRPNFENVLEMWEHRADP